MTKPLQESLREMLNRPLRWRTVLFVAWFAYWIRVPEWDKWSPGWAIFAGSMVLIAPSMAFQGWLQGERLRHTIPMGVVLALMLTPIIVALSYPRETLQFLVGLTAAIVGELNR